MMTNLLRRLVGVSVPRRFYQFVNIPLVMFFGGVLKVIHVVEFPRCGGGWIRHMLQSYLGLENYVNDRFLTARTVIQTHALYHRAYRLPIVMVRDPRDVFVSQYYKAVYMDAHKWSPVARYFTHDPTRPLREDFAEFLVARVRYVGVSAGLRTFFYREFLDSWLDRPGICLVRYEDCFENAAKQLARVVQFVGEHVDPQRIHMAVEENTFQKRTRARTGLSRKPGQADPGQYERKGIVGDWKDHFNDKSCAALEEFEGSSLRRLGYETDGGWIDTYLAELEQQSKLTP